MKTFASIYLGSNELVMTVYEISRSRGLKQIDLLRTSVDVMRDIYAVGRVLPKTMEELISTLQDMKKTAETYRCDEIRLVCSDALEKASNSMFVLDRIRVSVGLIMHLLSNSEHRFLSYQAAACRPDFAEKVAGTAIMVDLSGASMQMTLFCDGKICSTQHLMFGVSSVAKQLEQLNRKLDRKEQVGEILHKELDYFLNMFVEGREVDTLILLGENVPMILRYLGLGEQGALFSAEEYRTQLLAVEPSKVFAILDAGGYLAESAGLLEAFLLIHEVMAQAIHAKNVYIPGASINSGIASEYAFNAKLMKPPHDFEQDVINAAWAISRRYSSYQPHLEAMEELVTMIFDAMKKYHGMTKRDRLLLRVAAILHDCGKYISIANSAACSYMIIMSSEILGLTHAERELVAMVVAANRGSAMFEEADLSRVSRDDYIRIRKMLSILQVASALDRSHKQKFRNVSLSVRDGQLIIVIETKKSITLEKGIFEERAAAFEEVFAIRPVIRERQSKMVEAKKK